VKEAAARVLSALGVAALFRRRHRDRLLVLMYHGLVERPPRTPCWHLLDVAAFRRQARFLARRYRVLPLSEALLRLEAGSLPPRACAITFDDGFRSVATLAAPELARHGLPATVFLTTGLVGTRRVAWADRVHLAFEAAPGAPADLSAVGLGRVDLGSARERARALAAVLEALKALPRAEKDAALARLLAVLDPREAPDPGPFEALRWEDVEALEGSGLFELGPHTTRHEILSRCEDEVVEREVVASTAALRERLRAPPLAFSYPNGRPQDFDARARAAVLRTGLRYAFSTVEGFVHPGSDRLALPRVGVGGDLSLPRLALLASGALARLRGDRSGYGPETGARPRERASAAAAR
jgi:peptidoglycan/xylan/chitin deacetylase (PgdA/CDA1 family)